jgi:fructoselysine 6-phosphate deglycase
MINTDAILNQEVQNVLEEVEKRSIKNIFFVACGGSLALMYPSKYFLDREAENLVSDLYNSGDFILRNPSRLSQSSLVILCSQTGGTPETVKAAVFAKSKGALTVGITVDRESPLAKEVDHVVKYESAFNIGVDINAFDGNFSVLYQLNAGLVEILEGNNVVSKMVNSLANLQPVIDRAKKQYDESLDRSAEAFKSEKVIYTMASGSNYGPAYSHAICILMEMQWIHSHAIHSGEFFHGPFEILDKKVPFILLMGLDETRPLEERALDFLNRFGEKLMILDAKELNFDGTDGEMKGYLAPIVFNELLWAFAQKLAERRKHPIFTARRYMNKVEY